MEVEVGGTYNTHSSEISTGWKFLLQFKFRYFVNGKFAKFKFRSLIYF